MKAARRYRDEALLARIGTRVYQLRKQRGWSIRRLAQEAGLHLNTVDYVESGKGIAVTTLYQIARVLGVSPDELMNDTRDVVESPLTPGKRLLESSSERDRQFKSAVPAAVTHGAPRAEGPKQRSAGVRPSQPARARGPLDGANATES